MQVPETRYARAGDIRIAYQQWGEGLPLIIIPAFIFQHRDLLGARAVSPL